MTKGDCINRLFDAYGKQATKQRMYYYEQWAQELEVAEVSRIIDLVVKDCDYLPTVNKLYEISMRDNARESVQKNVYYCSTCDVGFTRVGGICPTCGHKGA